MNTIEVETETAGEFPVGVRVRHHSFSCDASVAAGGHDAAPGPHDYFDTALATCKAIRAMSYAKRHGIPLERITSHVESDDRDEAEGIYRLKVHVELFGDAMTAEQRAELERVIAQCPIHKLMTTADVVIQTVY